MTNRDSDLWIGFGRGLAIVTGPLWLPVYWLWQLAVAFVGICYYLVIERTLAVVLSRTMNRTRVKVRWYYVPLLILALPFALTVQVLFALWGFVVWWHRALGRWQWGNDNWAGIVAAIIFELVTVVVFVGSFHHPLPWNLAGFDQVPVRWYRCELARVYLAGPAAFGAMLLLIAPTIVARPRAGRSLQPVLFFPRHVLVTLALYNTLLVEDPDVGPWVNYYWLVAAGVILAVVVVIALMVLARQTLHGRSSWRQFVWFSAVRLLEKKRIALFSLAAVALCTAMLLIMVSVMGGFADNIREATHGLMGDIVLEGDPVRGFPHYEGFLDLLEHHELLATIVDRATPVIYAAGLFKFWDPQVPHKVHTRGVQATGIDLKGKIAVTRFGDGLNRYKENEDSIVLDRDVHPPGQGDAENRPGLIYGLDVYSKRDAEGHYRRIIQPYWSALLSVFPVTTKGNILRATNPVEKEKFYIIDDSRTGVYDIDSRTVYVGFKVLQRLLYMDQQELADGGTLARRAHQIQIKLRAGVDLEQARILIRSAWLLYSQPFMDDPLVSYVDVGTWEDYNRSYIAAVETEKRLMTILFGILSIVTVFMVLCIFYMIVVEKTRDIGILKSIGASSTQIALIFLAYAGVIGVAGSAIGTVLGWRFVVGINAIHDWIVHVFGWRVWNREVYIFDTIPNTVKTDDAINIIILAVAASIVGAIVPAIRAARMNPVEALRYE